MTKMIQNNYFSTIQQTYHTSVSSTEAVKNHDSHSDVSFQDILNKKSVESENRDQVLRFSKHAVGRLEERNIELSDTQLERLHEGAAKAGEKGINESLVLVDQLAFIVNVPRNTVITAMDQTETNQNIFTNIDGAVIV